MYCVVEFSGPAASVAIAHKNWLSGDSCYWPHFWKNNTKLQKALREGAIPDRSKWKLHPVHVIGNRYYRKCIQICHTGARSVYDRVLTVLLLIVFFINFQITMMRLAKS